MKKGKGKEYEDNKLKFEGDYINDKKNGKGKKYIYIIKYYEDNYNSNIYSINEVEYINDEKSGKGKEYKKNGVLINEFEYLNGIIIK